MFRQLVPAQRAARLEDAGFHESPDGVVADVLGPVQAMMFVTQRMSVEKAISAEAAYNVYGFAALSGDIADFL